MLKSCKNLEWKLLFQKEVFLCVQVRYVPIFFANISNTSNGMRNMAVATEFDKEPLCRNCTAVLKMTQISKVERPVFD